MILSRVFFWRLLYLLVLVGNVFQLIGFFLPYSVIIDIRTHTTIEADSYWTPLAQFPSENTSLLAVALSFFVLAIILVSMVSACVELFVGLIERPRSFSGVRLTGFIFALLGLLEYVFWSFASAGMASFCVADDPRNCVLTGDFGAGFWPSLIGSLISTGCFLALLILGLVWWRRASH